MKLSRRDVLALTAAATAAGGCDRLASLLPGNDLPKSIALPATSVRLGARLLNRAGFGPRPGEAAEVEAGGLAAWVDAQLAAGDSESPRLAVQLAKLDVWQEDPMDLLDLSQDEVVRQLNQADLLRQTYSTWQLKERMVGFWNDHFNIYSLKGRGAYRFGPYEQTVVRRNALGKFSDLLSDVAHSPAMLAYLDNQLNVRGVANENYARELMELHTLGVKGGYTQADVQNVARCFTGWTFERRFLHRDGEFRFDPALHDAGAKLVLGHRIPAGGGESDGVAVLALLASHPSTARFIAGKFCRHFLGDSNHPMQASLAEVYARSGGDIRSILRPLLLSEALLRGPAVAKRPVDFLVSALRATAADTDCGPDVQRHLDQMGQQLFDWPMPDGYPDRAAAWTGSMLARWNFALALSSGRLGGTNADFDDLARRTGEPDPGRALAAAILSRHGAVSAANSPDHAAALCLASPEFQLR